MSRKILTLMSGIIFGLGLTISSMTNPEKIKSFLDIFGIWDPSLIFVMGGGILVTAPLFHFLKKFLLKLKINIFCFLFLQFYLCQY